MSYVTDIRGTVSHGTLNPIHLIPCFLSVLDEIKESESLSSSPNPDRYSELDSYLGEMERRMEREDYFESEDSDWDLEWLFDRLNEYAPEGFYFGSIEGDGSDFGFWQEFDPFEDEDSIN